VVTHSSSALHQSMPCTSDPCSCCQPCQTVHALKRWKAVPSCRLAANHECVGICSSSR
jgi:hypothetical protein